MSGGRKWWFMRGIGVERFVEITSKLENVIRFMNEDSLEEVSQQCPDFWVKFHVCTMRLNQLLLQYYTKDKL